MTDPFDVTVIVPTYEGARHLGACLESIAANDLDAIQAALDTARDEPSAPSLIVLRSHIGYPSPEFTDSAKAHGNPFTPDEIAATKDVMGMPPHETFHVPAEVLAFYRAAGVRGASARESWQRRLEAFTGDRAAWDAGQGATGLAGWHDAIPSFPTGEKLATRQASNKVLDALGQASADLVRQGRLDDRLGDVRGGLDLADAREAGVGVDLDDERLLAAVAALVDVGGAEVDRLDAGDLHTRNLRSTLAVIRDTCSSTGRDAT